MPRLALETSEDLEKHPLPQPFLLTSFCCSLLLTDCCESETKKKKKKRGRTVHCGQIPCTLGLGISFWGDIARFKLNVSEVILVCT